MDESNTTRPFFLIIGRMQNTKTEKRKAFKNEFISVLDRTTSTDEKVVKDLVPSCITK